MWYACKYAKIQGITRGVTKMQVSVEMAIRNAEASLRMEGMYPSAETLNECRRVLSGEITHEQYVKNVTERYMGGENATVRS